MKRYIDVDKAMRDVSEVSEFQCSIGDVEDVRCFLENCEFEDVAPVKHGKWIITNGNLKCSNCKTNVRGGIMFPFCPLCGSLMNMDDKNSQLTVK